MFTRMNVPVFIRIYQFLLRNIHMSMEYSHEGQSHRGVNVYENSCVRSHKMSLGASKHTYEHSHEGQSHRGVHVYEHSCVRSHK